MKQEDMSAEEINEAVARKLGKKLMTHNGITGIEREYGILALPAYATSLSAAWEIVEKCEYFYLFRMPGMKWECKLTFSDKPELYARECDTAPLAICLAFLKLP